MRADSSASSPRSISAASTPRRWSLPSACSGDAGLRSRSFDGPGGCLLNTQPAVLLLKGNYTAAICAEAFAKCCFSTCTERKRIWHMA